jgi:hypothetical protein
MAETTTGTRHRSPSCVGPWPWTSSIRPTPKWQHSCMHFTSYGELPQFTTWISFHNKLDNSLTASSIYIWTPMWYHSSNTLIHFFVCQLLFTCRSESIPLVLHSFLFIRITPSISSRTASSSSLSILSTIPVILSPSSALPSTSLSGFAYSTSYVIPSATPSGSSVRLSASATDCSSS